VLCFALIREGYSSGWSNCFLPMGYLTKTWQLARHFQQILYKNRSTSFKIEEKRGELSEYIIEIITQER